MNMTSTHVFYLLFALFLIRGISERMALFGALRAPVERIQQHYLEILSNVVDEGRLSMA